MFSACVVTCEIYLCISIIIKLQRFEHICALQRCFKRAIFSSLVSGASVLYWTNVTKSLLFYNNSFCSGYTLSIACLEIQKPFVFILVYIFHGQPF